MYINVYYTSKFIEIHRYTLYTQIHVIHREDKLDFTHTYICEYTTHIHTCLGIPEIQFYIYAGHELEHNFNQIKNDDLESSKK